MAFQLGLPNQVPVPEDPFDDGGVSRSKSPKRTRGFGAGVKMPPAEGVTLEGIQQLLAQQSATIMEAQRATIDQLEARQNEKLQNLEKRIVAQSHVSKDLGTAIKDLEDRMAKVEHASRQPMGSGGQQDPKKLTLVFGGWGKQTRRNIILHQLREAVERLGLGAQFDSAPLHDRPTQVGSSLQLPAKGQGIGQRNPVEDDGGHQRGEWSSGAAGGGRKALVVLVLSHTRRAREGLCSWVCEESHYDVQAGGERRPRPGVLQRHVVDGRGSAEWCGGGSKRRRCGKGGDQSGTWLG